MNGAHPLIDVHVHLYPDEAAGRRAKEGYQIWEYGEGPGVVFDTADGVISDVGERYEKAGFDHAVVLQLFDVGAERKAALARLEPGLSPDQISQSEAVLEEALVTSLMDANRWVVSAAAAHPLLTAYVGIDPVLLSSALISSHLQQMAALGARGVKLHPVSQGCRPDDERLSVVYDLCCQFDLVVLSHSGPGHRGDASARPREFAPVLQRWPGLRLVLAHLGGASWTEAAALAESFPQVVFDVSEIVEWAGAPNAPSRAQLGALVNDIGPDRVMLGSDFPWYEPAATADKVATLPGLGPWGRDAVLGGNAVAHLGLKVA